MIFCAMITVIFYLIKKIEKRNDKLSISTTENLCDTIKVIGIRLSKQ